jgi:arginase
MSRTSVVGVPSSAGSYAAGQDQAPAALRSAGLLDALAAAGVEVFDDGDLPEQIWSPDRDEPFAQNVDEVVDCLRNLVSRLNPLLANGDAVLVLGGNCTIALAVVGALQRLDAGEVGLLYLDRQFDLNTPQSTTDGALDWMGLAHALALPGCVDRLADACGQRPLLTPHQVAWLGVDASIATEWERQQAAELALHVTSSSSLAESPQRATSTALGVLPPGPLAIHLDVDVLDFTDAPLAENTDGRNSGPTLDQLALALLTAARDPRLRAVSVGELNPTRSAGDPDAIPRFIHVLARTMRARQEAAST